MKRKTFKKILIKNVIVSIGVALVLLIISGVIGYNCAVYAVKKNYVHMQKRYAERIQDRYFAAEKRGYNLTKEDLIEDIAQALEQI